MFFLFYEKVEQNIVIDPICTNLDGQAERGNESQGVQKKEEEEEFVNVSHRLKNPAWDKFLVNLRTKSAVCVGCGEIFKVLKDFKLDLKKKMILVNLQVFLQMDPRCQMGLTSKMTRHFRNGCSGEEAPLEEQEPTSKV